MMKTLLLALSLQLVSAAALAQSNPLYVPLGQAKAVYYKPDTGPAPRVGIVVMHRVANYLSHISCTEFSKRGYAVLCMNSRFDNNEVRVVWETIALDVKAGIEYLKKQPGIAKVVLFGHSGGAPTMSFYQAVAENGVAFCQDPKRLTHCGNELAGLPRADGIVFADAHPGFPMTILRGFNPALLDENDPSKIDPSLDPFDPRNGYNPKGASNYSPEFQKRYFEGQSARMNRIIDRALALREKMKQGNHYYRDNDLVVIARGGNPVGGPGGAASLHVMMPSLAAIMSTREPRKLIRNDGSVVTQIVSSVAVPELTARETNLSFDVGTKLYSVVSFLSSNAVRSTNALDGIDHCSTNNSTVCAVGSIAVPQLFLAMGAANFIRDNELTFELSKAADKDYAVVEGALHPFTPCRACETTPGQYSNTVKNLFDYASRWIAARF